MITHSGIRFERHSEKSARGKATRCPRPCDNEHQIFPHHFPVFIHRQKRPRAIVRGIGYIHALPYQAIATVREHQQLTDATSYVKRESDASSERGVFLGEFRRRIKKSNGLSKLCRSFMKQERCIEK